MASLQDRPRVSCVVSSVLDQPSRAPPGGSGNNKDNKSRGILSDVVVVEAFRSHKVCHFTHPQLLVAMCLPQGQLWPVKTFDASELAAVVHVQSREGQIESAPPEGRQFI